jgi:glycosyltransferase involved in cell wall biosynthesis
MSRSGIVVTKTVAIDARWLVGGIGTYTENLLRGVGKLTERLEVHAITRGQDVERVREHCSHVTVVDVPIYTMSEQFLVSRAVKKCDLLHVPHFNVPLLHRGPLLVSIMDVIHLCSPEYRNNLSSLFYARPMLNAAARKADHIVTVSNHSKAQIEETLGIAASKISVIPCGVGEEFRPTNNDQHSHAAIESLGINSPYILYVGNLKPHKNVHALLLAFAKLRREQQIPHSLVIVGNDVRWKPSITEKCSKLGILDSTFFAPYVSPSLLPKVYAAAELLVMPSTAEGFGLPVIEAMACGTPVVCSHATCLPEIAGDAALYFDPSSSEELAARIELVLQSAELRASLSKSGLRKAKQYTWSSFVAKHVALYQRMLHLN